MSGNKYLSLASGQVAQVAATQTSTGVSNANQIPALSSTGYLDPSLLPPGTDYAIKILPSSENLSAGAVVNIYNNGGTPTVRNADCSNSRIANGYVIASTTSPANATIYLEGQLTGLSALTAGTIMYLSTVGAISATPPSTSGYISQEIGTCLDATSLNFYHKYAITLA